MKFRSILISILLFSMALAHAETRFTISSIRFEGLQRISNETASDYLPIKTGDTLSSQKTAQIINALYETGFFESVSISHSNNTLIIHVVERPTIASITVSGNSDISKEQIDNVLKNIGLIDGLTFNQAALDKFIASLQAEYENHGKYNVKITPTVNKLSRNRVEIIITVSEGRTAVIKDITFVGNQAFSSKKLLGELPLNTGFFSFIKHRNLFSQEKLATASTDLSNFYLDHGYVQFKVESTQVTVTPDHNYVYINFKLNEGPVYRLTQVNWAGKPILSEKELTSLSKVKANDTFSRITIQETAQAISEALGNKGYAFASVSPIPKIDEKNKTVAMTFFIEPGQRIYVRKINFSGNVKTSEVVLRREMRQPEGGVIAIKKVEQSTRRLKLLGYLEDVDLKTVPVPDKPDQVDLNYHVKEGPSAQALFSAGYGTNGLTLSAQLNQNDFLGSGKYLGINASTSLMGQNYSISYNNPYYTLDGVQRGFNVFYTRNTPGRLNTVNYTTDLFGGNVNYVIPISPLDDAIHLGFGLQNTQLNPGGLVAEQVSYFIQQNGRYFNQALFTLGWSRNGYDKAFFPTKGLYQSLNSEISGPLVGTPLDYMKITYHAHYYHQLNHIFTASLVGNAGYGFGYGGSAELPFFKNYYAGGTGILGSVRGYDTNSLGPRDSLGVPLGGNTLLTGTAALIFPNPVKNLRTSVFIDGGNVYNTYHGSVQLSQLRYSSGIAAEWQVPMLNFLLNLSAALPLNSRTGDETQPFQFSLGTNLD
ncbi:MAG: outer membrane protein assembly factor BamA [Gammaproteobacteria bacterium]|nr:outer membrane protein assembly factor BamA [Gammaproteobacteria bacterium]